MFISQNQQCDDVIQEAQLRRWRRSTKRHGWSDQSLCITMISVGSAGPRNRGPQDRSGAGLLGWAGLAPSAAGLPCGGQSGDRAERVVQNEREAHHDRADYRLRLRRLGGSEHLGAEHWRVPSMYAFSRP